MYPRDAQRTYERCEKYLQHLCNGMRCNKVHTYPNIKSNGQSRGVEGGEGKAGEGPARNRLCVCVGCLEKHFQARPKAARAAKRDSSESQVPRANGKRGELAGWLTGWRFSLATDTDAAADTATHTHTYIQ